MPNRLTAVTRNLSREFSEDEEEELISLKLPSKQERKQSLAEIVQVNAAKEMEWITHTQSLRMPYIPQRLSDIFYILFNILLIYYMFIMGYFNKYETVLIS